MKRIRVEEIDGVIYIDGIDIIKKLSELSKENDRLYLENDNLKKILSWIRSGNSVIDLILEDTVPLVITET